VSTFRFIRDGQAGRSERGHAAASGPRLLSAIQLVDQLRYLEHRIEIHFRAGTGAVGRDLFTARIYAYGNVLVDSLNGFRQKEQALAAAKRRIDLLTAGTHRNVPGRPRS
jgi:hypothetical protein